MFRTGGHIRSFGLPPGILGLLIFAAAKLRLGIGRSHGIPKGGIQSGGLYRLTRNPQIVGFGTFMIGFTVLWLTWRTLGTFLLPVVLAHMMVLTEEESLRERGGEDYEAYCRDVPRYLRSRKRIEGHTSPF